MNNKKEISISTVFPDNFIGSIDDLLNHVSGGIKPELTELEVANNDLIEAEIQFVMEAFEIDRTEAMQVIKEANEILRQRNLQETKMVLERLIDKGLVQISRFNEKGEAMYILTDLGRKVVDMMKNQQ